MRTGITSLVFLLAAGEIVPDTWVDPITRLGATGVLGTAFLVMILKTLPKMTADFKATLTEICNRHDAWEKVRHEDQQRLERLLGDLEKK